MRETKARLIRKDEVVGYERHDNHVFQSGRKLVQIMHSKDYMKPPLRSCCTWHNILEAGRFIDHDDKKWFTGKLDKNGKEIYEGDQVRGEWTRRKGLQETQTGVVEWSRHRDGWAVCNKHGQVLSLWKFDDIEVIGRAKK